MRRTLRQHAALIRPILRVFFAFLIVVSFFSYVTNADNNTAQRRETAKSQFDRAEKDRQALESRPEAGRSLKDYAALVSTYKRVSLITSHAAEVPAALHEVAELYRRMGDLFDEKYYQSAIDSYQFLLREYPTTHYREDAMLAIARIEQDDLRDPVLAQKSFEAFLALHPRSAHAAEARAALNQLNAANVPAAKPVPKPIVQPPITKERADRISPKAIIADKAPPTTDTSQGSPQEISSPNGLGPQVTRIRTWNADTYTRIVIDVGSQVKYQAARISGPDRIYFDIEGAKLNSLLLHKQVDVANGGFLKAVRIAQNQSGVVRVVLEVDRVKDYSVFLLPDPYRLIVDVYGTTAAAEEAASASAPTPGPTTTDVPPVKAEKPANETAAKTTSRIPETTEAKVTAISSGNTQAIAPEAAPADSTSIKFGGGTAEKNPVKTSGKTSVKTSSSTMAKTAVTPNDDAPDAGKAFSASASSADPEQPAPAALPAVVKKPGRGTKSAHDQAIEMGPPPIPELTRDGQHSLTRALGLKIGRIVIDPGHGGHDTGTIGPTGLMEKDLCLDISLRVGKLIEERLPGAAVVYTRDDDTFIPLEQRTEIANEARADLFLSVHANSSQDHTARGIETYYLNFTGSSDAMEVASRENALSENGVHDLQDIVKKIARSDKIEESRDLAGMIQDSLSKRVEGLNRGDRNRGVRKAPFVVLIGADMPSVLAEISFVSNPSDEQWLKKPENRQRIAEGLYHGIETYLQSTNSLANNQAHPAPGTRVGIVARSGNSQ
jgi:N-acetylmuramoyl-L-alanine amidase